MLINLISIWKEGILPDAVYENKANEIKKPLVIQSSFQFETPPRVIFVKSMKAKDEVTHYGDLPTVELQPLEQEVYNQTLTQLRNNPNFYNGKQMLLTGAVYDTDNNTLYLEAVRVDYVFLASLEKMKQVKAQGSALHCQDFFKTGVLAPFVSKDNKVSIITRKDKWNLRSVAAGFLECSNDSHPLNNLITETAEKEADEEFLFDHNQQRRLDFAGPPTLSSISFRDAIGMGITPTIEFVVPIQIKHDADFILSVMNNNEAPDAHEHVPGSAVNVPLDSNERETASRFMRQKLPGSFLYGPVLHSCAIQANPGMPIAHRIAEVPESRFYPMGIFKPTLRKALKDCSETQE